MKKLITMIAVGAVVATASADITSFKWSNGAKNTVTAGTYIYTMLDANTTADILSYVSAGTIDINDLGLFVPYNTQVSSVAVAPPALAGYWSIANNIAGTGAVAGQYAYAINGVSSTWGGIQVGDTLKIFNVMGPIVDLQPGGTGGVGTPQSFAPTTFTTVTVVPEPATVGLFAIGGIGAWMVRRNKLKSKEQADA